MGIDMTGWEKVIATTMVAALGLVGLNLVIWRRLRQTRRVGEVDRRLNRNSPDCMNSRLQIRRDEDGLFVAVPGQLADTVGIDVGDMVDWVLVGDGNAHLVRADNRGEPIAVLRRADAPSDAAG